jgi:hypothetical protein
VAESRGEFAAHQAEGFRTGEKTVGSAPLLRRSPQSDHAQAVVIFEATVFDGLLDRERRFLYFWGFLCRSSFTDRRAFAGDGDGVFVDACRDDRESREEKAESLRHVVDRIAA